MRVPERLHTDSEQLSHLASSAVTSLLDGKGVSTSKSLKSLVGRHVGNLFFHWQDPYYSASVFVIKCIWLAMTPFLCFSIHFRASTFSS